MAARIKPRRKMTLEARAKKLSLEYGGALKPEARDHVRRGFAVGYVAGWRARGRADRVTKAYVVGRRTTLAQCPIGLFLCGGELCLKTEYSTNEGAIEAFIVSSGEYFWGPAPQTIQSQRAAAVYPVSINLERAKGRK